MNARKPFQIAALIIAFSLIVVLFGNALVGSQYMPSSETTVGSNMGGAGSASSGGQGNETQNSSGVSNSVSNAAGGGGEAFTGASGQVDGLTKGTQVPVLSPFELRRYETLQRENELEQIPETPVDPNAPVRNGPPLSPESAPPQEAPIVGSGSTQAPSAPGSFVYYRNADLGSGTASIIGETSHASNGMVVLETWNWYAAISRDGGRTWTYYNPATLFPTTFGGFCCDQIAYYDQAHDTMFWILQYNTDGSGNNAIRIAWAKGQADLAAARFCYTDFTAQQLGSTHGPSGTNYDQPKFARSNNFIYLDIQRYGTASGATIIRVANSEFSTYPTCNGINYQFYIPNVYSPGFTQRAYSTMYFAGHATTSTLRVFKWPESVGFSGITSADITHRSYPASYPYLCPRTGGSATSDWCQRRSFGGGWAHTDRIFTGWVTSGIITFVWDAGQGTAGLGTFNYPFLDFVRVNESAMTLNSEFLVWSSGFAWQYATAALNDNLNVAGTFLWGGGSYYQNCGNFIWDSYSPGWTGPASFGWESYAARNSNSDPNDTLSGDYLATRRNGFNGNTWSGSCYSLVGGGANANVHPYYLWFGRAINAPLDLFIPIIRK